MEQRFPDVVVLKILSFLDVQSLLQVSQVNKGTTIWKSPVQQCFIISMTTIPQRHLAFTVNSDDTLKVWNCQDKDALAAITMSEDVLSMEAFLTKDGPFLVLCILLQIVNFNSGTGGRDGPVHVVTTATDNSVSVYTWEKDGRFPYLTQCCHLPYMESDWTPSCNGMLLQKVGGCGGIIKTIAYLSGSGLTMGKKVRSVICGVSLTKTLHAWDVHTGTPIWASPEQERYIICMTTLPQRHLAFTLDSDGTLKVWNCQDKDALGTATISGCGLCLEAFLTKDGPVLVVGDDLGYIHTFTVPDLRNISRINVFSSKVKHLVCSPDRKYIIAVRCDHRTFPEL
ncbi:PREDICTED: uncharacterized protein LOC102865830 [Elephantulus edwardii]|uniref:uncharacterized protein LOC102865830 n=1 Tax=Elephantulus edwardii TaxID=28737 RepID=UPI0003F0DE17|nr:PREDICTED: uncharacterized protein LOC102865830 [Elephantulus edwardii]